MSLVKTIERREEEKLSRRRRVVLYRVHFLHFPTVLIDQSQESRMP
jgi:hypothetical protein